MPLLAGRICAKAAIDPDGKLRDHMLNALEVVMRHDLKGSLGRCDFLDRKSAGDG